MSDSDQTGAGNGSAPRGAGAGAPGAGEGAPPAAGSQPPLTVHSQYVRDLSFENPNAPASLTNQKEPPKIEVKLDVGARRLQEQIYELLLKIDLTAKQGEQTAFVLELEYGALCTVDPSLESDAVQKLLMIEGARTVFPFARRVIADVTRDGGFPPVLINTIDFHRLYEQRRQAGALGSQSGPQQGE